MRRAEVERRRKMVQERVSAILANEIICPRCGATYWTMNKKCSAPLEERCPGFLRWDEVQKPIEKECGLT